MPFLTFTPDEQAVIAHKALMGLEAQLSQPVVVSPNGQSDNLVGNIRLNIEDDVPICSVIAKDSYTPRLGSRSILRGVADALSLCPL